MEEKKQRAFEAKQKQKAYGPGATVRDPNSPLCGMLLNPIDFLKDSEFRKKVSVAFKSQTREQANKLLNSK